jgi:isoamylase
MFKKDDNSLFVLHACRLHDKSGGDIYIAFNAHDYFLKALLPTPPTNRRWFRVVRFSLLFGTEKKNSPF